jgi:hypothetical protein
MYEIMVAVLNELGFEINKKKEVLKEDKFEINKKKEVLKEDKSDLNEMKTVLNKKQYEIDEAEKGIFFAEKSSKDIYYFFDFNRYRKDINIKEEIITKQKKYYENMIKRENNNVLQKNTTLIIFIEIEDMQSANNLKGMTLELEEDKYFFRKLVLIYTKREVDSLKASIVKCNLLEYINNEIRKNELFTEFKKGSREDSYSLLLKMMVKIPVLNYHIDKNIDLVSLSNIIETELTNNNLNKLVDNVLSLNLKGTKKQSDSVIDEFIDGLTSV